jgi:hypothetical protein
LLKKLGALEFREAETTEELVLFSNPLNGLLLKSGTTSPTGTTTGHPSQIESFALTSLVAKMLTTHMFICGLAITVQTRDSISVLLLLSHCTRALICVQESLSSSDHAWVVEEFFTFTEDMAETNMKLEFARHNTPALRCGYLTPLLAMFAVNGTENSLLVFSKVKDLEVVLLLDQLNTMLTKSGNTTLIRGLLTTGYLSATLRSQLMLLAHIIEMALGFTCGLTTTVLTRDGTLTTT